MKDNIEWVMTLIISIIIGWCCYVGWMNLENRKSWSIKHRKVVYEMNNVIQEMKTFRVTAYCSCKKCCGRFADGITANGHVIKSGDRFVAASKNISFDTVLDIPGYGKVPVWDRGGAIKEDCLDVYFDTHQEALNWGIQILEVSL